MNMYHTAVVDTNDSIKKFMLKHFFLLMMFFNECNVKAISHTQKLHFCEY